MSDWQRWWLAYVVGLCAFFGGAWLLGRLLLWLVAQAAY
jgi:hypothetical protein